MFKSNFIYSRAKQGVEEFLGCMSKKGSKEGKKQVLSHPWLLVPVSLKCAKSDVAYC